MPHNVSVGGFVRYTLVHKPELSIVVEQFLLARQHKALAPAAAGAVPYCILQECAAALTADPEPVSDPQ